MPYYLPSHRCDNELSRLGGLRTVGQPDGVHRKSSRPRIVAAP